MQSGIMHTAQQRIKWRTRMPQADAHHATTRKRRHEKHAASRMLTPLPGLRA